MCNCGGEGIRDIRYVTLEKTLKKYRQSTGKIIPVLQEIQDICGYIPEDAIRETSRELGIPSSEIYGGLPLRAIPPAGQGQKHHRVCTGTACHAGEARCWAITNCLG